MKPSERIKAIMRTKYLKDNEDYVPTLFELAFMDYLDEQARTQSADVNKLLEDIKK